MEHRATAPAVSARHAARLRVRRWEAVLACALLFSLLPTLSFMGHWDVIFQGQSEGAPPPPALIDYAAEHAEEVEHTQHCHENLASCAAQPLPAGAGFFLSREILLRPLVLRRLAVAVPDWRIAAGLVVTPPSPPPRHSRRILVPV